MGPFRTSLIFEASPARGVNGTRTSRQVLPAPSAVEGFLLHTQPLVPPIVVPGDARSLQCVHIARGERSTVLPVAHPR